MACPLVRMTRRGWKLRKGPGGSVELSEMTGTTRADLEQIKAYISRRDDGIVRLSYPT